MHRIQLMYAQRYCKKYQFIGHVWQGRFKNLLIESDSYLFACGNYIEMNPVRAGLVTLPEDWEWSSYRYYAFGAPDPIIEPDVLFEALGRSMKERREAYRQTISKTRPLS